jgi:hypothetical protein
MTPRIVNQQSCEIRSPFQIPLRNYDAGRSSNWAQDSRNLPIFLSPDNLFIVIPSLFLD